jgi:hypothetical protein
MKPWMIVTEGGRETETKDSQDSNAVRGISQSFELGSNVTRLIDCLFDHSVPSTLTSAEMQTEPHSSGQLPVDDDGIEGEHSLQSSELPSGE